MRNIFNAYAKNFNEWKLLLMMMHVWMNLNADEYMQWTDENKIKPMYRMIGWFKAWDAWIYCIHIHIFNIQYTYANE